MRIKNFKHAYEGLKYAIINEHNMKIHLIVAAIVMILAMIADLSTAEFLILFLAISLVFITEMINTAIEKLVDFVSPDYHDMAKIVKDTAAGAVLCAAGFAFVAGVMVFFNPFDRLLTGLQTSDGRYSIQAIWAFISLLVIIYAFFRIRMVLEKRRYRPNFIMMIVFAIAGYTSLQVPEHTQVFLLTFLLAFMFAVLVYYKLEKSLFSIVFGSILGVMLSTIATLMLFYL